MKTSENKAGNTPRKWNLNIQNFWTKGMPKITPKFIET